MPYFILVVVLVGIDQLVKWLVNNQLALGQLHTLIPGLLGLTNLRNSGAAWSILAGQQFLFFILTIVAIAVILYLMRRYRQNQGMMIALSLILAGAIGNFIDRLIHGYVVDMFETLFINFPVFNVADTCLTLGVIYLVILILLEKDD
ncbi:signal peptidase II [Lactobacillus sp. 3B(2020)]|uniref:signal peptidase II n=1 Tax=Lactobacillus sp. 3B(2020) TaxID=2695882 RepID=UPI0015DF786F|nr:signal peptidase II [Lactobacillus sp. 3B(2020)]QLL69879.1 signal peptidase II [Lactobacillus sp. 3B(2020)]